MDIDHLLRALGEPGIHQGRSRQDRLYQLLKAAILDGRLAPGSRLPSSRVLAADGKLARNSVIHAYAQLAAEGFLQSDRGGTRVPPLPQVPAATSGIPGEPDRGSLFSRRSRSLALRVGDDLLPFAPGVPDLNAFPWQLWARCLQRAWGEVSVRQLAYAAPGGEGVLRRAIATHLQARRGVVCRPEQVFITAGAQAGLDACARLLADHGDRAWLEEPGYPAARAAMQAAGLEVVAVPVDREGMAAWPELWRSHPPRLIYLTPSHQYPLGSVLSLERRLEFLARAGERCWIVEDDYDSEFRHGGRPLTAIQGLAPEAPVIYVGTFSKLLYPGLRIGYLVVPPWAVNAIGSGLQALARGGQAVEQRAIARFIDSGHLTRHLRRMRDRYEHRQACLRQALAQAVPDAEIRGGAAGLHLTVLLPQRAADVELARRAASQGVVVRPLSSYFAEAGGQPGRNGLILGYGMAPEERIPELVARLVRALEVH